LQLLHELGKRERYRQDPETWVVDRLGVPREMIDWELRPEYKGHAWDGTPNPIKLMFQSLAEHKWVAVEGATGTSKTYFAACALLWFLECFEGALIVTSAPKGDQLKLNIWKNVGELYGRFGRGELTTLKLRMDPPNDNWAAVGFVAGVKTEEVGMSARRAQGIHAEHMFIITEDKLAFGFGFIKKTFDLSDLVSCEPYTLTFGNYYGYGIRFGRDGTIAYNTRNGPGIKLVINGVTKPYVISVKNSGYICKLLNEVIDGKVSDATGKDEAEAGAGPGDSPVQSGDA